MYQMGVSPLYFLAGLSCFFFSFEIKLHMRDWHSYCPIAPIFRTSLSWTYLVKYRSKYLNAGCQCDTSH